jgi:multidrug resistance efflux pump
MTRAVALPVVLVAIALISAAAAQTAENKSEEPESFDVEPPVLKQNLSNNLSSSEQSPDADVARAEKQLERARRNASGAERLCKIGVLAKVEVEQRLLRVIRCESDLANARVACAKEAIAGKETQLAAFEITKDEFETLKSALTQLIEAAQVALAKRERAELEFAEANLRRQQKLLKAGVARESDVAHAEEKLAEIKAAKN